MVKLVGILNVTPDSFSDGNKFLEPEKAIAHAKQMIRDGADYIDIGAESTRPNAPMLSYEQEWQRLEPVLKELLKLFPGKISVDTYHPETAEKALALGNVLINDVTGMNNPAMVKVVVDHKAKCVISHLPGTDIQAAHNGKLIDDINVVKSDLLAKASLLESQGVKRQDIILDPGIGFGKTHKLSAQLVEFAKLVPDYEVMIGYSKKRFLGDNRMEIPTNIAAGKKAVAAGAAYLRVHDVAEHRQLVY